MNTAWNRWCRNLPSGTALTLYDNRITPIIITDITGRRNVRIQNPYTCTTSSGIDMILSAPIYFYKVPVRYMPNAASGRWGYGRDLCHCCEKGIPSFDIISLNIHKTTSHWYCMAVVLRPRLLTFACLAWHPANCSTALHKVFSSDLPVCQCIRTHMLV